MRQACRLTDEAIAAAKASAMQCLWVPSAVIQRPLRGINLAPELQTGGRIIES